MIPMKSIIDYERGPIWDFVSDQTGLSDYDILQLQNVIHQNILKYKGDHNYLQSKGQSRRIANKIQQSPDEYIKEGKGIIEKIGIKKTTCDFDTYYGAIRIYAFHKHPHMSGTGYSDIFHKIKKLKKIYTGWKKEFDSIHRRLAYIETMGDEIYYLLDRFNHNIKPYYTEWLTNRFETFTSFLAQSALHIVGLYYDIHPELKKLKRSQHTFKNILNLLKDEISFFDSANDSYYSLVLVEIRNSIVHGRGIELENINDEIFVNFEVDLSSQNKLKNYNLRGRMEKIIIPLFKGVKKPNQQYFITDPNFNFIIWELKAKSKKEYDTNCPKIKIHLEMREYIDKMMKFFLYQISIRLLKKLLDQKSRYWDGSELFGRWIKEINNDEKKSTRAKITKSVDYQFFECFFL
jgi:hypothetical protein